MIIVQNTTMQVKLNLNSEQNCWTKPANKRFEQDAGFLRKSKVLMLLNVHTKFMVLCSFIPHLSTAALYH